MKTYHASIVIPSCEEKVLLLQRGSTAPISPDMWAFPGGFRDSEGALETAAREMYEETGLHLPDTKPFLWWDEGPFLHARIPTRSGSYGYDRVEVCSFLAHYEEEVTPTLSAEHQSFIWVKPSEAINTLPMRGLTRSILQWYAWVRDVPVSEGDRTLEILHHWRTMGRAIAERSFARNDGQDFWLRRQWRAENGAAKGLMAQFGTDWFVALEEEIHADVVGTHCRHLGIEPDSRPSTFYSAVQDQIRWASKDTGAGVLAQVEALSCGMLEVAACQVDRPAISEIARNLLIEERRHPINFLWEARGLSEEAIAIFVRGASALFSRYGLDIG